MSWQLSVAAALVVVTVLALAFYAVHKMNNPTYVRLKATASRLLSLELEMKSPPRGNARGD